MGPVEVLRDGDGVIPPRKQTHTCHLWKQKTTVRTHWCSLWIHLSQTTRTNGVWKFVGQHPTMHVWSDLHYFLIPVRGKSFRQRTCHLVDMLIGMMELQSTFSINHYQNNTFWFPQIFSLTISYYSLWHCVMSLWNEFVLGSFLLLCSGTPEIEILPRDRFT